MTRQAYFNWALPAAAFGIAAIATPAPASVILHGTRVIYSGDARDATITVENKGSTPVLVQTWVDSGNESSTPEDGASPYLLNPPLFRLDPSRTQSLRLIQTSTSLPQDRESVHWLNVLEIPPETTADGVSESKLRILLRSRIKVFYRPKGLAGKPDSAAGQVEWSFATDSNGKTVLRATNPTAYHVTFVSTAVELSGQKFKADGAQMVAPGQTADFSIANLSAASGATAVVEYTHLNDLGAQVKGRTSTRRD